MVSLPLLPLLPSSEWHSSLVKSAFLNEKTAKSINVNSHVYLPCLERFLHPVRLHYIDGRHDCNAHAHLLLYTTAVWNFEDNFEVRNV